MSHQKSFHQQTLALQIMPENENYVMEYISAFQCVKFDAEAVSIPDIITSNIEKCVP